MENNNTKNMKKFRKPLVIVAMVLMVALVCGMGAMTYSKYISTTDVPAQNATAAKWGFVVTANTSNLFGKSYNSDKVDALATVDESGDVVVKASAGATDEIIAPGTSGYLLIQISGEAEVLAQLTVNIDLTKYISDGGTYRPIEWALTDGNTMPATGWTNDPETLSTTKTLAPGTSASGDYRLYWRWVFSSSDDNDKKDTVIGAKAAEVELDDVNDITGLSLDAAAYNAYTTELEFTATVSIVQIQDDPATP